MKVLQVIPTYYPAVRYGGPIFAVHGLAKSLVARGHDVEVFTTNVDGQGHSEVPLRAPVLLDGVTVRYFECDHLRRLYWSPPLGEALRREVRHFDLVHLHSVFLWPTWSAARAALRASVPYIVSPRGMLVKELIRRRSRLAKTIWINLVERKTLGRAAAIHVTSDLEAKELRHFGWRLPQIATIANGVDDPWSVSEVTVARDIREICVRQPLILFVGRLSWKKGLERLVEAFALTTVGQLVIAGTDEDRLAPRLRKQAVHLGVGDRVSFLPRTLGRADIEHLFAAARLFVLPSYSENFGNTVLEAMRRGIAVVVTPEVGAAEIVRRAGAGAVVTGNVRALAEALNALVCDRELTRRMGEFGRIYVRDRYGWPSIAKEMEKLYSATIKD
jgi:glycosyltransferase involved in cell wall biosynthesis